MKVQHSHPNLLTQGTVLEKSSSFLETIWLRTAFSKVFFGEKIENEEKLACGNIFDHSFGVFGCSHACITHISAG